MDNDINLPIIDLDAWDGGEILFIDQDAETALTEAQLMVLMLNTAAYTPTPIIALTSLAELATATRRATAQAVANARRRGDSWDVIAAALSLTESDARETWG